MYKGLFSALFVLLAFALPAQQINGFCGTHGADVEAQIKEGLLANKRALANGLVLPRNQVEFVPIKFHLVGKTDGSSRIDVKKALSQLKLLNQQYEPLGITFYLPDSKLDLLNNSAVYTDHFSTQSSVMQLVRDSKAINVWVVESADDGSGSSGGTTLAYYSPFRDWVVVSKGNFTDASVLAHELGHFFDMLHTFNGWDGEPRDEADWLTPAPNISPGGVPTERADSSNCETAGDYICDTPADYNLGLGWPNCNFDAVVLDPVSDTLAPEESLFMGYFLNCPADEYYFSDMQIDLMLADLASSQRNYLRNGPTPFIADITEDVQLLSPADQEVLPTFDDVTLTWSAVENARKYVLDVSRFASFPISSLQQYVVSDTTFTLPNALEADEKYYWRVLAFNDTQCGELSDDIRFETGLVSASPEPDFVEGYLLSPNPLRSGQQLSFELSTTESFRADWQLYDITGRQVGARLPIDFQSGNNAINIPVGKLPMGVYIWRIHTETGYMSGRLVVAN